MGMGTFHAFNERELFMQLSIRERQLYLSTSSGVRDCQVQRDGEEYNCETEAQAQHVRVTLGSAVACLSPF